MATALFDTAPGAPAFYGLMGPHSKLVQLVAPGQHFFVANNVKISHVLKANVEPGKRYYVLLRFIYGRGFQMRPLRRSGPSDYTVQNRAFRSWISRSKFVQPNAEAFAWDKANAARTEKARVAAMEDWEAKRPDQRAELTLNPEDGVPVN